MKYQAGLPSSSSASVNIESSVTTCNDDRAICTTVSQGGAGAVIDDVQKLIVTNYHVVDEMIRDNKDMVVTFVDPHTLEKSDVSYQSNVIGYDKDHDIAVLQMVSDITPPCVAFSDVSPTVSDEVSFVGTPSGRFEFSRGRVRGQDIGHFASLELDATIAVGYSGSVVVNKSGQAVGVMHGFLGRAGDLQGDIAKVIDAQSAIRSINNILRDNASKLAERDRHDQSFGHVVYEDLGL